MDQHLFGQIVAFTASLHALEHELGQGAPRGGISPLQERMLLQLHTDGPASVGQLADCLSLAQPNASRELGKLHSQGLVEKRSDPAARRSVIIALSPAGASLVAALLSHMAAALAPRLDCLDHQEREAFTRALQTVASVLFDPPSHKRYTPEAPKG